MSEREEYTPDTEDVRETYERARYYLDDMPEEGYSYRAGGGEFNRWLAAHDRELREQIAREMLSDDAIGHGYARLMAPRRGEHPVATFSAAVQTVISNAAQIARGEEQTDE